MIHERLKDSCEKLGFIHIPEVYDHHSEEASKIAYPILNSSKSF
jgi:hypothetical protein